MRFEVVLVYLVAQGVTGVQADTCRDPPVWLVVLDAVAPCIGIVASLSYFCLVRCCTTHNKKYFQKILRYLSLANWFFFVASIVFLILSCEGVRIHIFGGERVTEWAFVGAMCFSWLVMMIESYVSRERWYIKHLGKRQEVLERIEKLKETEPKIIWSVVGYNMETRDVPVRTVKLPCTTPTVKFEDSKEYVYKYWVDHSARKEIGNSGKSVITRIKLKNEIEAGDYNTRVDMEAKKEEWKKNLNER